MTTEPQQPGDSQAPSETHGPSDPPLRSLALPTGSFSLTDEGPASAPAIVAIHGLPGSARDFRWLAPHLHHARRFIRLEMPGFGSTPLDTAPDRSIEGRARYALDAIRTLGVERPVLIGHSMGGVVATAAVSLAPDEFAGLGLLSSPGTTPHAMLRRAPFKLISRLLANPIGHRLLAPINRRGFAALGFKRYPDHELVGAIHCVAQTPTATHRRNVLGLSLPTLVAYCQDDPLIEVEVARELAEVCPDGPRLVFETGGHNPQKSHAREIARALLEWPAPNCASAARTHL